MYVTNTWTGDWCGFVATWLSLSFYTVDVVKQMRARYISRQTTADWLNVMEKCLHHILQEMIRKVHSKTSAYGPFQFEAPVVVSNTLIASSGHQYKSDLRFVLLHHSGVHKFLAGWVQFARGPVYQV